MDALYQAFSAKIQNFKFEMNRKMKQPLRFVIDRVYTNAAKGSDQICVTGILKSGVLTKNQEVKIMPLSCMSFVNRMEQAVALQRLKLAEKEALAKHVQAIRHAPLIRAGRRRVRQRVPLPPVLQDLYNGRLLKSSPSTSTSSTPSASSSSSSSPSSSSPFVPIRFFIRSIQLHYFNVDEAYPGNWVGVKIQTQTLPGKGTKYADLLKNHLQRGMVIVGNDSAPVDIRKFVARILLTGKVTLKVGSRLVVHCHTGTTTVRITQLSYIIDKGTGEVLETSPRQIKPKQAGIIEAEVISGGRENLVCEPYTTRTTAGHKRLSDLGRVLFRDNNENVANGVVLSCNRYARARLSSTSVSWKTASEGKVYPI